MEDRRESNQVPSEGLDDSFIAYTENGLRYESPYAVVSPTKQEVKHSKRSTCRRFKVKP